MFVNKRVRSRSGIFFPSKSLSIIKINKHGRFHFIQRNRNPKDRPPTSLNPPTHPPPPPGGTVLSNRITTLTGLLVSKGEFFLFKNIRIDRLGHSSTPSKGRCDKRAHIGVRSLTPTKSSLQCIFQTPASTRYRSKWFNLNDQRIITKDERDVDSLFDNKQPFIE